MVKQLRHRLRQRGSVRRHRPRAFAGYSASDDQCDGGDGGTRVEPQDRACGAGVREQKISPAQCARCH